MDQFLIKQAIDQAKPKFEKAYFEGTIGDVGAHKWRVMITNGGVAVDLMGASVSAKFIRPDGVTVEQTDGTASGNVAEIVLDQLVYAAVGRVDGALKIIKDGVQITEAFCEGNVARSSTDSQVAPEGTIIPDLAAMQSAYNDAVAATSDANDAASSANSAAAAANDAEAAASAGEAARSVFEAWSETTAYVAGNKVADAGSSYVCIAPNTNQQPPNSTYWLLMAAKGDNTTAADVSTSDASNVQAKLDAHASQLADNTSLLDELNAPLLSTPYDYLSGANNGYLSYTSRWMLNKTVPAGVTIDTVQLQIVSVAAGTVEVDGWTLASGTYTRVFHATKATSAVGTLTVDVDFETTTETYITVCTTEAIFAISYNTANGNSYYRSGDKVSTSFLATGLNIFPNLAPNVKVNCVQSNKAIDRLNTYGRKLGAILTVDANGHGDYTTIQAAVNAAPDGATILIYPGTYHEQVACFGRVIHLVGTNKQTCILYDDSADYATPPLELGNGSVQNMTIIEDHGNPAAELVDTTNWELAYCVHVEDFTGCYNKNAVTLIENCILRNTKRAALGMGTYKGHTIIVRNCDIYSGAPTREGDYSRGAAYFHSMAADFDGQGQRVKFINTTIRCADDVAIYIGDPSHAGYTADMEVEFINTLVWSEVAGKADSVIVNPFLWSTVVSLADSNFGNNVAMLNA